MPRSDIFHLTWARQGGLLSSLAIMVSFLVSACASAPLSPYSEDSPPLVLVPVSQAGVVDKRGRFREIFCGVLEARGSTQPGYRACDEALVQLGSEPDGTGKQVELGESNRQLVGVIVPGVGWDCFSTRLDPKDTSGKHFHQFGYDLTFLKVDALSSSEKNARQIHDAIIEMASVGTGPDLVLIGYSKGVSDILEAVVAYPQIRKRVVAVISVAGTVGGSPLANDVTQSQLELLKHWPGSNCSIGDGGAIESLRPAKRKTWLANHPLPHDFPYYSLVTYPKPERISSGLKSRYIKLSQVDARNDGQVLFYDQVIPESTLLGYVNADHWALVVPIAHSHSMLSSIFDDQNQYPREALLEALLRIVEEDLFTSEKGSKHR